MSECPPEAFEEALLRYGAPEIFNIDQGSEVLRRGVYRGAAGPGRARDINRRGHQAFYSVTVAAFSLSFSERLSGSARLEEL
jgi:hypothetical protein